METKNNINKWKISLIAVCSALLLGLGFYIGRRTIKTPEPQVIYVPGDTIEVGVPYPDPVYITKPIDTMNVILSCLKSGRYYKLFPERIRDSIVYVTKDDSTAVIKDWASERVYSEKIFDIDTVGVAIVNAKVQYNRLTWLGTKFTPIEKVVIKPQPIKKFSPFVGGGITTMPTVQAQAGLFFEEKYGFSGTYQYDWQNKNHIFGTVFLYKF
jgi:hypothetical protein